MPVRTPLRRVLVAAGLTVLLGVPAGGVAWAAADAATADVGSGGRAERQDNGPAREPLRRPVAQPPTPSSSPADVAAATPITTPAAAPVPNDPVPSDPVPSDPVPHDPEPDPDPDPAAVPAPPVPVPAAGAAPPVTAEAGPAELCSGRGWQQRRGEAALASLRPAQPPTWSLTFQAGQDGYLGMARPALQAVEIYVRSCDRESDDLLRHVLAHELGHAYDQSRLSDAQRAEWLAARGLAAGTPWQGCHRCTDFATPAGDFAEVYAQWRRGASDNRSELAGSPSPADLEDLAVRFFGA